MALTLYGGPTSGNCHKVARMLKLCGLPATYRFVNLKQDAQHDPAFRTVSPLGEIPALVDGESAFHQSPLILKYLAEKTGKFGPDTIQQRQAVESWLIYEQQRIFPSVAAKRFIKRFTPEVGNDQVFAYLGMQAERALREVERQLCVTDYLAGEAPTIADIACSGYLLLADEADIDIPGDWPQTAAWLDRLRALPGWVPSYALLGTRDGPL